MFENDNYFVLLRNLRKLDEAKTKIEKRIRRVLRKMHEEDWILDRAGRNSLSGTCIPNKIEHQASRSIPVSAADMSYMLNEGYIESDLTPSAVRDYLITDKGREFTKGKSDD